MATIRRYYERPAIAELDSVVTGVSERADGASVVTLSETIFYPEGGGQPCDLGDLARANKLKAPKYAIKPGQSLTLQGCKG